MAKSKSKSKPKSKPKSKTATKKKTTKTKASGPAVIINRGRDPQAIKKIAEDFVAGKKVNPNAGLFTESQWDKMNATYKEDRAADKKTKALPFLYQPAVVQIAMEMGCDFIMKGQKGEKVTKFRDCHIHDVRKHIYEPGENLSSVGSFEYILGIQNINAARSGNFEFNNIVAVDHNFNGRKEVTHLVGQINNRVIDEKLEAGPDESEGGVVVWLPNQRVVWGYLKRSGKNLTHDQIRKMKDAKGVKFEPLKTPIVGCGITEPEWWKAAKKEMSAASTKDEDGKTFLERWDKRLAKSKSDTTPRERGWENLSGTQVRTSPHAAYCFGFRSVQLGIVPFICYADGEEDTDNRLVNHVIGRRLVEDMKQTAHVLKRQLKNDSEEDVVENKPAKPKKKSSSKKKTSNPKKDAVVEEDPPPVDDQEPVTNDADDSLDDDASLVDKSQREQAEADAALAINND